MLKIEKESKKGKIDKWTEFYLSIKELRESINELKESQKKTDEQLKRTDKQLKKTDEQLRETDKKLNKLTDGWGRFVEGMIEPSCIEFMRKKGFRITEAHPRLKVSKDGGKAEYDLVVVTEKVVLLVSAKVHVSSRDVDELKKDMKNFFDFLPRYKGLELWGAIAGMSFGRGADKYALNSGFLSSRHLEI